MDQDPTLPEPCSRRNLLFFCQFCLFFFWWFFSPFSRCNSMTFPRLKREIRTKVGEALRLTNHYDLASPGPASQGISRQIPRLYGKYVCTIPSGPWCVSSRHLSRDTYHVHYSLMRRPSSFFLEGTDEMNKSFGNGSGRSLPIFFFLVVLFLSSSFHVAHLLRVYAGICFTCTRFSASD